MEHVHQWIEGSSYAAALGVSLEAVTDQTAELALPFNQQNSNPGDALHGGCAASLGVLGAHAVTRAALGATSGPWHTTTLQVNYLAAAIGEEVRASAKLRRRGKALCFVDVDVQTADGKPIAACAASVRGRFDSKAPDAGIVDDDDGTEDPGVMGPFVEQTPFIAARGIHIERMTDGRSRLRMGVGKENGDQAGGLHEGAVLALLDTAGAMAAWAETGPGAFRASTPSMQAQIITVPPATELVAYANVVDRDGDIFWCHVDVARADTRSRVARGTVLYRIAE